MALRITLALAINHLDAKCSRHSAKLRISATWLPRTAQSSSPFLKCPLGLGGRCTAGPAIDFVVTTNQKFTTALRRLD